MVNVKKLKGKIVESGKTVRDVAELMDMDKSTLYRKLGTGESVSIKDMDMLIAILHLTPEEVLSIFFTQLVA